MSQIYVGLFPCNECAKVIIQSGIKEVVYMSDKYAETMSMKASRRMFDLAKVHLRQYTPMAAQVTIDFSVIEGPTGGSPSKSVKFINKLDEAHVIDTTDDNDGVIS